jgi:hypothetical protein
MSLWLVPIVLAGAILTQDRQPPGLAHRERNLIRIVLALHAYHERYSRFPGHAIADPDGQPLLSWRVALLPFLGQEQLYRRFKLDEPWDSPSNKKLLGEMPAVYALPVGKKDTSRTPYQVFVGPGTVFESVRGISISGIPDGVGNTLLVIEAAYDVEWTRPKELPYRAGRRLPPIAGRFPDGFLAAYADGRVRLISNDFDLRRMRLAIVRNDGWGFPEERGEP